jgi:hypothetical protein
MQFVHFSLKYIVFYTYFMFGGMTNFDAAFVLNDLILAMNQEFMLLVQFNFGFTHG